MADGALYPLIAVPMYSVACSVMVVMQLVAFSSDVTGAILVCCINGPIAVHSVIGELASFADMSISATSATGSSRCHCTDISWLHCASFQSSFQ